MPNQHGSSRRAASHPPPSPGCIRRLGPAPSRHCLPAGSAGRAGGQNTPPQSTPGRTLPPPTASASRASAAGRSTPQLSNSHTASSCIEGRGQEGGAIQLGWGRGGGGGGSSWQVLSKLSNSHTASSCGGAEGRAGTLAGGRGRGNPAGSCCQTPTPPRPASTAGSGQLATAAGGQPEGEQTARKQATSLTTQAEWSTQCCSNAGVPDRPACWLGTPPAGQLYNRDCSTSPSGAVPHARHPDSGAAHPALHL